MHTRHSNTHLGQDTMSHTMTYCKFTAHLKLQRTQYVAINLVGVLNLATTLFLTTVPNGLCLDPGTL